LGRPRTIYAALGAAVVWMGCNVAAPHLGQRSLDAPPFYWMQGGVALLSLLMTTMVLTTQQRQMRHVEKRSHLDLQVNLLSEQKIAKIISLLEELRRDLPSVVDREDPVAAAMTESVDPGNVVSALEEVARGLSAEKEEE
jgi:uncharacterized membrane protein